MFRNVKIGDKVWDFVFGEGVITEISDCEQYPLVVTFKDDVRSTFSYDGKFHLDYNQTLFWDRFEFTPPAKPFDLVDYLNKNLIKKEFKKGEDNFYLYYDHEHNVWETYDSARFEEMTVYFDCINIEDRIIFNQVAKTLTDKKITPKQLKQACKELGWI